MWHSWGRGGGGRSPGGTATLPKHSQLQGGAGACQCGAGKTVGDITDVYIVHLKRKTSQEKFNLDQLIVHSTNKSSLT